MAKHETPDALAERLGAKFDAAVREAQAASAGSRRRSVAILRARHFITLMRKCGVPVPWRSSFGAESRTGHQEQD